MWIFFSILAPLCWAIANAIDKYILTKWVKKPLIPIIITGVVGLATSSVIYFIRGFSELSSFNIFLALTSGVITILLYVFYFKAIQIEEASRIVPLFYLSPLFVLILAAIFLNEVFTPEKYLGIFLLIAGAVLISIKNFSKISFGKAVGWMALSAVFGSITALLAKYLLNLADFWTIFSYRSMGMAIGSLPIAYFYFSDLRKVVKQFGKRTIVAISASETMGLIGILFITIATSAGFVTLVNALSSIQPFFVLIITGLLGVFYPHIIKEESSRKIMFQKTVAIIVMFVGVLLIM
ncbi:MAG: EamA family transporter [bacterium]|nr:EamA family transporter [bacterium]